MSNWNAASNTRAVQALHRLSLEPDEEWIDKIFETPVLLRVEAGPLAALEASEGRIDPALPDFIQELRSVLDPFNYPLGQGPVEGIVNAALDGTLRLSAALAQLRHSEINDGMTLPYVYALGRFMMDEAAPADQRMIIADCLDAATSSWADTSDVRLSVIEDWLDAAYRQLILEPNGALYARAQEVADHTAALLEDEGRLEAVATFITSGAVCAADPYYYGRDLREMEENLRQLEAAVVSRALEEGTSADEIRLPPVLESLGNATTMLRRAIDIKPTGMRYKALTSVLVARRSLGDGVSDAEVINALRSAEQLLGDLRQPDALIWTLNTLRAEGCEFDRDALESVLLLSVDEMVRRLGPGRTLELRLSLVGIVASTDPTRAVQLLREQRPLVNESVPEPTRLYQWDVWAHVLEALHGDRFDSSSPPASVAAAADALTEQAHSENWDITDLAVANLSLAVASSQWSEEEAGIVVLDRIVDIAPLFATEHADLLAAARARLCSNLGVTYLELGNDVEAVKWYGQAITGYLGLGIHTLTLSHLQRIQDLLQRSPREEISLEAFSALTGRVLKLGQALGQSGSDAVTQCVKSMLAGFIPPSGVRQKVNPELLVVTVQFAKAQRSAAMRDLTVGQRLALRELRSPVLERLMREIDVLDDLTLPASSDLREELLSSGFGGGGAAGSSAAARLANLHAQAEALITLRQFEGLDRDVPPLLTAELQALLPADTVLLILAEARTTDVGTVVICLAVSDDEIRVGAVRVDNGIPIMELQIGPEDDLARINEVGFQVSELRSLARDPGSADDEWTELADTLYHRVFWGIEAFLESSRGGGKQHLCVVPTGSLYHAPLHLLGPSGRCLADDWVVTVMPTVHHLRSLLREPLLKSSDDMASIGLGFADSDLFVDLPEAVTEAVDIARLYGVEALVDDNATPERVKAALLRAGRVHIASHGVFSVGGPSFHAVVLSGPEGKFGLIAAHEVELMDLRHVDLLTLSACDTALGRFDVGDNLVGLPAAFLTAGCRTVIGTLWEIETTAARTFFIALHEGIASGRSKLHAFRAAQTLTREAHPDRRDWGAFYLMGEG